MRAVVDTHYRSRMFLAEANQWPEDVRDYFGDGDECHMAYHFPLMPRMYMAIAQEDRYPIVEILEQTPDIPDNCQWAIFLRNHDELTLEMVTDRERDYMYRTYAADPRMRVNVGIRRRLAPLMDNDSGKIKLMNSLLLSMPGTPILYYGDEIGMGDNIYLGDRNGVRTPMQWSPDRNAGFSKADPQRLYLPPIMDPIYGYEAVNVEAQQREPASLLNWMKRMIAVRRNCQAFGRGRLEMLRPGNRKILAYVRSYGDDIVLCVANLSRSAQPVELDLKPYKGSGSGGNAGSDRVSAHWRIALPAHPAASRVLLVSADRTAPPVWHEDTLPGLELRVLVLFHGWKSFFVDEVEPSRRAMATALHQRLIRTCCRNFCRPSAGSPARAADRAGGVREIRHLGRSQRMAAGAECGSGWPGAASRRITGCRWRWPGRMTAMKNCGPVALCAGQGSGAGQNRPVVRRLRRRGFLPDPGEDDRARRPVPLGQGWLKFTATRAFAELAGDRRRKSLLGQAAGAGQQQHHPCNGRPAADERLSPFAAGYQS
jgi:maltose alpha-D-glucosyltransferase/alpha-amylase